ncbi:MAG: hypothetical protein HY671_06220 [Chloroflexi bacterium]|nr:hypothetical protein [Chloroflexota bacterium]
MFRTSLLILACVFVVASASCASLSPKETPAQQGVSVQQFNQRVGDLEKRLKALEDAASQPASKQMVDLRRDLDDLRLRLNLLETRPMPGGLSPDEKAQLERLDKRVKALEPTPTPTGRPASGPGTPASPSPTPASTPVASAVAVTALEKRVDTLEKQVQQLDKRAAPTPIPIPTQAPTLTPTVDLGIVNHSYQLSADRKTITITGEVVNNGKIVATPLVVVATLYKIDGTVLGSGKGTPLISSLPPGQSTPFSFTITGPDFNLFSTNYKLAATTATSG